MKFIIGKKLGMTQIFDEIGNVTPVTVIEAGPCYITQLKIKEADGYEAVQLGFGNKKKLNSSLKGHLEKSGKSLKTLREKRYCQEGKVEENLKIGDEIKLTAFTVGDIVEVTAISKGKGFAGTIKRHNFHRGPKTHGSRNYRQPGSIGAGYPEHVMKGKPMPGAMGREKTTVKNLEVIALDENLGTLAIKGAIPGPKKGIVVVEAMVK